MDDDDLTFALDFGEESAAGTPALSPRLGRDEMNLAEFPFTLLSDRTPEGENVVKFEDTIEGKDGKQIQRRWTVIGGEGLGLPLAGDEQVYVALMEVTREQGFDQRTIFITRYDLIKRIGWPDKGDSYRRLRDALDRLLSVTIKAERAFWDKSKERYVDVGFHIIDDYALYDEAPGRKLGAHGQESLPLSFVSWNQVLFRSFQAGNLKQLDTGFYFSLKSALSRRLYRYLDKKRYDGKETFRIGLKKLAFEKLGMSRNYFPSHIRQELQRAHEELQTAGFIEKCHYIKPREGEELVIYFFPHLRPRGLQPVTEPQARAGLTAQLVDAGVTAGVAAQLLADWGDEVSRQLQYLPYRSAQEPAAVLVEAIRSQWEPPASYLKVRADNQRKAQEDAKRAAEVALTERQARDAEGVRNAVALVCERLSAAQREELEAQIQAHITVRSPAVAQRPQSAVYQAMYRAQLQERVCEQYIEEFRAAVAELEG